jgi:hypothetical protein
MNIELKEGTLYDFNYAYLFSNIPNRWDNAITCQVKDTDEYVDVKLYSNSKTYYVNFKTVNKKEKIGTIEMQYNDHFFFVSTTQVVSGVNYDNLCDEEKEYLEQQWQAGRVKAWYGYDIVVRPKYDAEIYKKGAIDKELTNGETITYNYTDLMNIIYLFDNLRRSGVTAT